MGFLFLGGGGSLTISTTRLSGKKYVIEQKILHNLSKSNSCMENFDTFTKILLKNLYFWANYSTFVFEKFGKKCDEKNETYSSGKIFSLKSC